MVDRPRLTFPSLSSAAERQTVEKWDLGSMLLCGLAVGYGGWANWEKSYHTVIGSGIYVWLSVGVGVGACVSAEGRLHNRAFDPCDGGMGMKRRGER